MMGRNFDIFPGCKKNPSSVSSCATNQYGRGTADDYRRDYRVIDGLYRGPRAAPV